MDINNTYTPSDPISFHGIVVFIQSGVRGFFSFAFLNAMYVVLSLLAIVLITFVLFLFVLMFEIRQEDKRKKAATVKPAVLPSAVAADPAAGKQNETWKHIRERLLGDNPSDWKLAMIEGDIYLDHVLDDKGFHGDTTSDKLKQVTPDKLPSIQVAWETHLIRNRIAHDGAAFVLTMPEARRLLSSYEMVFTDLGVI